jgi:hypothetical protein
MRSHSFRQWARVGALQTRQFALPLLQGAASELIRSGMLLCPKTHQLSVQVLLYFATVHHLKSLNTHQIYTYLPSLSALA